MIGKEMGGLEEIYRAIACIEANLQQPLSVSQMAAAAGYSLFYFSRLFTQLTGHSPYDYLMRRRLTDAALTLRRPEPPAVTQLAFDYQFGSPEAFSRSFKKLFGVPPAHFARQAPGWFPWRMPLTRGYLAPLQTNAMFSPRQIPGQEMRLVYDLAEPATHGATALLFLSWGEDPGGGRRFYVQVSQLGERGGDTQGWAEIPQQSYACFNHRRGNLALTYQYIWQTWLPLSAFTPVRPYVLEWRPGPGGEGVEIWVPLPHLDQEAAEG